MMDAEETLYLNAKTSVWWDFENCQLPKGSDPNTIARNIRSALLKANYCGQLSIYAYGDTNRIPPKVQQAINSTGIGLNHIPSGSKDASDKKILVDMLFWAVDHPAPANFLLISGDRDFSNALHQLSMRRYNILLAQPQQASATLIHAATTVWMWASIAAGGLPLNSSEVSELATHCQSASEAEMPPTAMPIPSKKQVGLNAATSGTGEYSLKMRNKSEAVSQTRVSKDSALIEDSYVKGQSGKQGRKYEQNASNQLFIPIARHEVSNETGMLPASTMQLPLLEENQNAQVRKLKNTKGKQIRKKSKAISQTTVPNGTTVSVLTWKNYQSLHSNVRKSGLTGFLMTRGRLRERTLKGQSGKQERKLKQKNQNAQSGKLEYAKGKPVRKNSKAVSFVPKDSTVSARAQENYLKNQSGKQQRKHGQNASNLPFTLAERHKLSNEVGVSPVSATQLPVLEKNWNAQPEKLENAKGKLRKKKSKALIQTNESVDSTVLALTQESYLKGQLGKQEGKGRQNASNQPFIPTERDKASNETGVSRASTMQLTVLEKKQSAQAWELKHTKGEQIEKVPHKCFSCSEPSLVKTGSTPHYPSYHEPSLFLANNFVANPQHQIWNPSLSSDTLVRSTVPTQTNGFPTMPQNMYPLPLGPPNLNCELPCMSDGCPPNVPGNGRYSRNDGPSFALGVPVNVPDIGKLDLLHVNHVNSQAGEDPEPKSLSSHPSAGMNAPKQGAMPPNCSCATPPSNNCYCRPETLSLSPLEGSVSSSNNLAAQGDFPSECVQDIDAIFYALRTLRTEKLKPVEANMMDCIRFGDPKYHGIDIQEALNHAIEHDVVVKQNVGKVTLYTGKNEKLWTYLNTVGGKLKAYPETIWDRVQKFLMSYPGRLALLASECRYEAALALRNTCLYELTLGDVLRVLHMVITKKKWIIPHQSGWQPISITLAVSEEDENETHAVEDQIKTDAWTEALL